MILFNQNSTPIPESYIVQATNTPTPTLARKPHPTLHSSAVTTLGNNNHPPVAVDNRPVDMDLAQVLGAIPLPIADGAGVAAVVELAVAAPHVGVLPVLLDLRVQPCAAGAGRRAPVASRACGSTLRGDSQSAGQDTHGEAFYH